MEDQTGCEARGANSGGKKYGLDYGHCSEGVRVPPVILKKEEDRKHRAHCSLAHHCALPSGYNELVSKSHRPTCTGLRSIHIWRE